MKSKEPPRNRLGKALPAEWQEYLEAAGVPRRKYTAVCRAEMVGGRVVEDLIIEQGWIIGVDRSALAGRNDKPISIDPRQIVSLTVLQVI